VGVKLVTKAVTWKWAKKRVGREYQGEEGGAEKNLSTHEMREWSTGGNVSTGWQGARIGVEQREIKNAVRGGVGGGLCQ